MLVHGYSGQLSAATLEAANPHHYGLILAGGRGTRFWPRSRRRSAKQVLNVVGTRSLIQNTVDRLRPVIPPERLWVLTNDYLRDEIVRQLPEVPGAADPGGACAAQYRARHRSGRAHSRNPSISDAVMGVFPADHMIAKEGRYRQLVRSAFRAAERGQIVVLGIPPRWPETGYGYIEFAEGLSRDRNLSPSAASRRSRMRAPRGVTWRRGDSSGMRECFLGGRAYCSTNCGGICRAPPAFWRRCLISTTADSTPRWRRRSRCARTFPSIMR